MESITKKEELRNVSLVTAEELADVLSVSTRQVYRWAANGTIPSRKLSHKVRRFQVKEVVAWLESRRQGPRRAA